MDRQKLLQSAERLLKQGKTEAALSQLRQLAMRAGSDPLTYNRIGDLLARGGQAEPAIEFYSKIAEQFAGQGFFPKAIAIHKKILRLSPDDPPTMIRIGELYLSQKLPGEAREYLRRAADSYAERDEHDSARGVYERLVAAEPDDPRHRAKLAETRAAAGETDQAGDELLALGATLLRSGSVDEAEQAYQRAGELLAGRVEPVIGRATCLEAGGKPDEALTLLEQAATEQPADGSLSGALLVRYEQQARHSDVDGLLDRFPLYDIPAPCFVELFRAQVDLGGVPGLWERYESRFVAWSEGEHSHRLILLYEQLVEIEPAGHLPALERLRQRYEALDDSARLGRALERIVEAHRAAGDTAAADAAIERLRAVAPSSKLVSAPDTPEPAARPSSGASPGKQLEAPAVPLNRADEGFVTGGLTQSEILDKYGLKDEALEQVLQVTQRFPGHIDAQRKRVALSRKADDQDALRAGLVALALACQASGETDEATQAIEEARTLGALDDTSEQAFRRDTQEADALAVEPTSFASAPPDATSDVDVLGPAGETPATNLASDPEAADAMSAAVRDSAPVQEAEDDEDDALLIDLGDLDQADGVEDIAGIVAEIDEIDEIANAGVAGRGSAVEETGGLPLAAETAADGESIVDAARELSGSEADGLGIRDLGDAGEVREMTDAEMVPDTPAESAQSAQSQDELSAAAVPNARSPAADVIAEVRRFFAEGQIQDAARRIEALQLLGYSGDDLDALAAEIAAARVRDEPAVPAGPAGPEPEAAEPATAGDHDMISSIASALEETGPFDPGAVQDSEPSEQSLTEVFAAFKERVAEEVGAEDFRTHYDLGIAYKEMGMTDEAIGEFSHALDSPDLNRDACSMIAVCHRELGQMEQAADWYRRAIASDEANGGEMLSPLRYALAEALLDAGQRDEALDLFRDVLQEDPAFRDVRDRVAELELATIP